MRIFNLIFCTAILVSSVSNASNLPLPLTILQDAYLNDSVTVAKASTENKVSDKNTEAYFATSTTTKAAADESHNSTTRSSRNSKSSISSNSRMNYELRKLFDTTTRRENRKWQRLRAQAGRANRGQERLLQQRKAQNAFKQNLRFR